MTKPSYEELERYKEAAEHVDAIQARTIRELRAELLRVRGLLQRLSNAWEMDPHGDEFIDLLQELGGFGESADIGKLDTADKSGIDEQFKGMATDETYQAETLKIEKEFAQSDWEALQGSAETGGEKAAPDYKAAYEELESGIEHAKDVLREIADACDSGGEPEYAYKDVECNKMRDIVAHLSGTRIAAEEHLGIHPFETNSRRSSQNQTVSSGVEGAHEGTTADKSVVLAESSLSQNADSSAPTIPAPLSTQLDTTKEKV